MFLVILDQMITIRGRLAAKLLRTYSKQNCKGSRPYVYIKKKSNTR